MSNVDEKCAETSTESKVPANIIITEPSRPLSVQARSDLWSPNSATSNTFVTEHLADETPTDDRADLTLQYANQINQSSNNMQTKPKIRRNENPSRLLFSYSPPPSARNQNFMTIEIYFTETILPNKVSQSIANVYAFINKLTTMAHCRDKVLFLNDQSSIVYNYGFCHKQTGEPLYCIADIDQTRSNDNHTHYKMQNKLFTQQDMQRMGVRPPVSSRDPYANVVREKKSFEHKLRHCIMSVISAQNWNRIRVFNTGLSGSKQDKKQHNTMRFVLQITGPVFVDIIKKFVFGLNGQITLIPMIMFVGDENDFDYRVEYLQIVRIRDDTDIGISYYYDRYHEIKVAGIHVNERQIMEQHQLVASDHQCNCLEKFKSPTDDIQIGNPDDAENRYKDMKHRAESSLELKDAEIQELKRKVEESKTITISCQQLLQTYPPAPVLQVSNVNPNIYGQQSVLQFASNVNSLPIPSAPPLLRYPTWPQFCPRKAAGLCCQCIVCLVSY